VIPFVVGHEAGAVLVTVVVKTELGVQEGSENIPVGDAFKEVVVHDALEVGSAKRMLVLLKQFVAFTSGTSEASAKIISTHYPSSAVACASPPIEAVFWDSFYTHIIQSTTMIRYLYNLNRRKIANLHICICWQCDLRQAESAWVGIV
jgi:hypothetical protein